MLYIIKNVHIYNRKYSRVLQVYYSKHIECSIFFLNLQLERKSLVAKHVHTLFQIITILMSGHFNIL